MTDQGSGPENAVTKAPNQKEFEYYELDPSIVQQFARHQVDLLTGDIDRASGHGVEMSKWLTASLLALNSGGLIAILNAADHVVHSALSAGAMIAGTMAALASGWTIQVANFRSVHVIKGWRAYWGVVAERGQQNETSERNLAAQLVPLRKWERAGPALGWLSSILFLVGAIAAASALK